MENGDLCQEGREEEGVEGLPVPLLFGSFEVAGGGAKKGLRDWEANFLSFRSKGDLKVKGDHRRLCKVANEGESLKSFSKGTYFRP